jgi:predicted phosphate transport protein (TIGR00153 family)
MALFWKKQADVRKMIDKYLETVDLCMQLFNQSMMRFLNTGCTQEFTREVEETHKLESIADDLRRKIQMTLYGKALLPDSRGDLLTLLEFYDKIPGAAEDVLFLTKVLCLDFHEDMIEDLQKLVGVNVEAYRMVRESMNSLFENPSETLYQTRGVDAKESESDRLERSLIERIFKSDMDTGEKMLFKELVQLIGKISDRAENAADRIGIVAIKRQI